MTTKRNLRGKALQQYKESLTLTDTQKDIIVGSLLGDGTMGLRSGKPLYSIKFEQSVKHEKYIYHLAKEFENFCGSPPAKRWIDKEKTRQAIWFRTYRHHLFIFYFNLFYRVEKKPGEDEQYFSRKIVPSNIAKFLNPRVLAYWFMDDGTSFRDNRGMKQYYLSTQGFQKSECARLCNALNVSLNIQANVHKDRDRWRIYILRESAQRFIDLISPYIVSDLTLKL